MRLGFPVLLAWAFTAYSAPDEKLGGRLSLDVKVTPFSSYDATFIAKVQGRWYDLMDNSAVKARSGKVAIDFVLTYDGRITNVKVRENEVGEILGLLCQRALLDPAPYDRWPDDMRRMIGSNKREASMTFYYTAQSNRVSSTAPPGWQERHFKEQLEIARKRAVDEETERRQKYVDSRPDISDRIRTNILAGSIVLGMTTNDVFAVWGKPQRKSVSVYRTGIRESWIYSDTFLIFEDGKLSSWHSTE